MNQKSDCECDLSEVLPMSEWLEQEKEGECRPCAVAVLIKDYQKELREAGREDLAGGFASIAESEDPVKATVELMDKIKDSVDEELKINLLLIDCMAQASQENNIKEVD